MLSKSPQIACAHVLPKTHKHYERLPKFRSIIDTTNTLTMAYLSFYKTYLIH